MYSTLPAIRRGPVTHPHGTHCAGLIVSRKVKAPGIAPFGNLVSCRATFGGADPSPGFVVAAFDHALEQACNVVSCSFTLPDLSNELAQRLDRAHEQGVTVVAAAGNDPHQAAGFPENAPNVIVVGASRRDGSPWLAKRFNARTDLMAPGERLKVVNMPGHVRTWLAETSGACAVTAGVAAVLLGSVAPARRSAVARTLRETLMNTARILPIHPVDGVDSARMLNPLAALEQIQ